MLTLRCWIYKKLPSERLGKDLLLYLHVMLVLLTSSQVIDAQGYTPKYQWWFEKLSRFLKSVVLEPVFFFADISNLKRAVTKRLWNSCGWLNKIDTLRFSVEWLLWFLMIIYWNFLNYKSGVSCFRRKDIRISIYSGSRKYAYSQFYNRIIQFTKAMPLSRHLLGNFHVMHSVQETRTRPRSNTVLE